MYNRTRTLGSPHIFLSLLLKCSRKRHQNRQNKTKCVWLSGGRCERSGWPHQSQLSTFSLIFHSAAELRFSPSRKCDVMAWLKENCFITKQHFAYHRKLFVPMNKLHFCNVDLPTLKCVCMHAGPNILLT